MRVELWRPPRDLQSRNLYWGPGGKEHAPHSTYTFTKEDLDGTTPKLKVRDENGMKWRIKLGPEARSETAASRLVWAVGYSVNQFYFVPHVRVEGLPAHLRRGQVFVSPDGSLNNVEMKRYPSNEDKTGHWRWSENPFSGSRELNGLRVMMALINNWDLKEQNNAVYEVKHKIGAEDVYRVSDLGASFGSTGGAWQCFRSKDDIPGYVQSSLIRKRTSSYVDFNIPARPGVLCILEPPRLFLRLRSRWIGERIPRSDARWMGNLLSRLTTEQIRDAFRAGGYGPMEVKILAQTLEKRIRELCEL